LIAIQESASDLLESTIASIKEVLRMPLNIEESLLWNQNALKTEMCVLVGFTGQIEGRLIIDGGIQAFGKLGETMYGMVLQDEMLQSFVGEIANMVAGNMCTYMSQKGLEIDITPPTVLIGEMKLFGFEKGVSVPITIQDVGEISIILLLQEEKVG
jgi:chemotaxis protein CheX